MKKILAIVFLCLLLCTGCAAIPDMPAESHTEGAQTAPETVVLFDTPTCKITLEGTQTTIEDKASGTEYSYTTKKTYTTEKPTLEQIQARCIARTSADTDTLKIELAGALIVVHDLAGNQTYYIQH